MSDRFLFTSECVTEGHPDKIADQVSDAILDACLEQDPYSRVAAETLTCTGLVVIAGEITTKAYVDFQGLVRGVIASIGYDNALYGFDSNTCAVISTINKQSGDIAQGVDTGGAGDQGMMFGYATSETPELMPAPISLAHKLTRRLSEVRKNGKLPYLRPDGKSQVTVEYGEDGKPARIDAVVISSQHSESVSNDELHADILKHVIQAVLPAAWLDEHTKYHINPTGRFVIGGPMGDTGLTGRKIIVDTYGGMGRHGGGAFSGKDPTKVDRTRGLHGASHRQEHCGFGTRGQGRGPACIRHRRGRTGIGAHRYLRHRQGERSQADRTGAQELHAHSEGYYREPESAPAHLPKDRGLRPLRPHRTGVHLGSHRQGHQAGRAGRRGDCSKVV